MNSLSSGPRYLLRVRASSLKCGAAPTNDPLRMKAACCDWFPPSSLHRWARRRACSASSVSACRLAWDKIFGQRTHSSAS